MAKLGCALALASLSSLIKANAETEADLFKDLQYMPVGTQMTKSNQEMGGDEHPEKLVHYH